MYNSEQDAEVFTSMIVNHVAYDLVALNNRPGAVIAQLTWDLKFTIINIKLT